MQVRLRDVASVIRSKNAGPFELTLDVLLKDDETFEKLKNAEGEDFLTDDPGYSSSNVFENLMKQKQEQGNNGSEQAENVQGS